MRMAKSMVFQMASASIQRWAWRPDVHGEEHGLADDILVRPGRDRIANGEERGLVDGILVRPVLNRIAHGKGNGSSDGICLNQEMGLEAGCAWRTAWSR